MHGGTKELQRSLDTVSETVVHASQQLSDNLLESSTLAAHEIQAAFTDAMQGQAKAQFDEMASVVAGLSRTLQESSEGLTRSQKQGREMLSSVMTGIQASMREGTTAMTKELHQSLGEVSETVVHTSQQLSDNLLKSSTTAVHEIQAAFDTATRNIADSGVRAASQISSSLEGIRSASLSLERSTSRSEQMLRATTTIVDRFNELRGTIESANRQVAALVKPIGQAALDIDRSSYNTKAAVEQIASQVQMFGNAASKLSEHQDAVERVWKQYQTRFEGIDESLGKVFEEISEGLAAYCNQVRRFANELDKTTEHTIRNLAAGTHELNDSIEDLIGHIERSR